MSYTFLKIKPITEKKMISNQFLSLVLPCKNEQTALNIMLNSLPKQIDEVIVVDNGSSDETVQAAKKFGAKVISEIRNDWGVGYGYAFARGIQEANGDIIICMDGDGSYPTDRIGKMVNLMEQRGWDFISCNRTSISDMRTRSPIRAFGVAMLNIIFYLLFGYRIKDCLSGMWVFKKATIYNFDLFEGGWNFSLEIKLNAITNSKIKFTEISIPYHDRIYDRSKQNIFKTGLQHLLFLFRAKFLSQRKSNLLERVQAKESSPYSY